MRVPRPLLALLLSLSALSGTAAHAQASTPPAPNAAWAASWQAPQSDAFLSLPLNRATVRQFITPHAGGDRVRLRISNLYGVRAVNIGAVTLGVSKAGAELAGAPVALTFNGASSISLARGESRLSDPVALPVAAMQRLAVSIHVTGATLQVSRHFNGNEYVWVAGGNQTAEASGDLFRPIDNANVASTLLVDRLEVQRTHEAGPRRVVAMFGDSITDGFMADLGVPLVPSREPIGKDVRYPDQLQRRALAAGLDTAFVSAAISGSRLLSGPALPMFGPSGQSRLARDVLSLPGVTDALVLIGINDLGFSPTPRRTGEALKQGLADTITRLKLAGIRVTVGTLLPSAGTSGGFMHGSAGVEAARQSVNAWIRTSGAPDAVVDFDACMRDPADPSRLRAEFDSSDHLHPSTAGYAAMAECVSLDLFR